MGVHLTAVSEIQELPVHPVLPKRNAGVYELYPIAPPITVKGIGAPATKPIDVGRTNFITGAKYETSSDAVPT